MADFDYKYLIIGGGMAGDAAVQGIREMDRQGSIGMISAEAHPPYNRPPLTKGLWKGDPVDDIWRKAASEEATLYLSTTVAAIDPKSKQVTDTRNRSFGFDKLLLATGGTTRRLPFDVEGMIYYRTFDDYNTLRAQTEQGHNFVVIGGGFIGWEVAAALAMNGKSVTMVFQHDAIGSRLYPPQLAGFLNHFYETKGVRVLPRTGVKDITRHATGYRVALTSDQILQADGVVAGLGIEPNIELARAAGLEVGNGIVVDEYLRTSHPDIYAAGDVANFYYVAQGHRTRVEHEDQAEHSGKTSGANMAGANRRYDHQPFFYSDLFELGYEAVGDVHSGLDMVEDWQEQFRTGVVYYLQDKRVRGVLLWNVWGKVDDARKLIAENQPMRVDQLRHRIHA